MIRSLNLALSNRCTAHCVFCPKERGQRDPGFMSLELIQCMLDEIRSPSFPGRINTIQLGENGDALLNPMFPYIVCLLRYQLPGADINLTTNLVNMKASWFRSLMRHQMIDSIGLNIDGHDAESYEAQKDLPYSRVIGNLKMLMEYREEYHPDLKINITVLPLQYYCDRVMSRFGCRPMAAPEYVPPCTFDQVKESLVRLPWFHSDVRIRQSPVFFWAERNQPIQFDPSNYVCPQFPRVENEAFISPSGLWYPCCLDANQDQAYGNVGEKGLMEIYNSPRRVEFIRKLNERRFTEIGFPCNRVAFCGAML